MYELERQKIKGYVFVDFRPEYIPDAYMWRHNLPIDKMSRSYSNVVTLIFCRQSKYSKSSNT